MSRSQTSWIIRRETWVFAGRVEARRDDISHMTYLCWMNRWNHRLRLAPSIRLLTTPISAFPTTKAMTRLQSAQVLRNDCTFIMYMSWYVVVIKCIHSSLEAFRLSCSNTVCFSQHFKISHVKSRTVITRLYATWIQEVNSGTNRTRRDRRGVA